MDKKRMMWAVVALFLIALSFIFGRYSAAIAPQGSAATIHPVVSAPPAGSGEFVSATPTSVSIKTKDGAMQSFSVTPSTPFISQVASGEVGKSLADTAPGTQLLIIPMPNDPAVARNINVLPLPPYDTSAGIEGNPFILQGTVVDVKGNTVNLQTQDGVKNISITSKTTFVSNVTAGQTGKGKEALAAGIQVVAGGIQSADGALHLQTIQMLIPIAALAQ